MTQRPLTSAVRAAALIGVVMIAVIMSAVMVSVIHRWSNQPHLIRIVTIVGVGGVFGLSLLLIDVARRGLYDRRRHNHLLIGMSLLMMGGLGIGLVNQGLTTADAQSIFAGSVLLALCGLFFVMHLMEQQHLTTLEKIDALERRLNERGYHPT